MMTIRINDRDYRLTAAPGTTLLSFLHNQGLYGTHRVCDTGDCGACTVWVDGQAVHSCIYPARRADGRAVTTIEGLATNGQLTAMQQAFVDCQGFQCGYCTPGMIMSASKLEVANETELRRALDGNLCRCTGYQAIVQSMLQGYGLQSASGSGATPTDSPTAQVGQSLPQQDSVGIVTGAPLFTTDWAPPGLLHLAVVRSPYAHARIRRIDTSKALALPGVHAVFTHADVPRRPYTTAGHGEPVPDPHDHYLLDQKVRFVGDRVAAVVAESVAIAKQACELVEVDYEVLPHVLDPVIAIGDEACELGIRPCSAFAPQIHDEPESFQIYNAQRNIAGKVFLEKGDLAAGFEAADFLLERVYHVPAVQHMHLEPHATITWLDADGMLHVRSSTQVPFHCQRLLSQLFDIPKDKIHVFKTRLGGGFGNKQEILTEDLCTLATLRTGHPVQWVLSRQEEFTATNSRHAAEIHLKVGVRRDGSLAAVDMIAIANTGAYGNHGTQVVFLTGSMPLGLYRCEHQRFRGYSVYTNTMPAGAFRGYGATQGYVAMESLMDEIATMLQIDPLELRQQQVITPDDRVLIGADHHFHLVGSYGLKAAIAKVASTMHYKPGTPPIVDGARRRGIGFAISMQGSGLAKIHLARVRMALKVDGRYELRSGAVDLGTGCNTTLRQIAADVLHTTINQIDIITADTLHTPFDSGAYASATTYITGQAVILAAEALRSCLLTTAAAVIGCEVDQLQLTAAGIQTPTQGTISLSDLAKQAGCPLEAEREYAADKSTLTFAVQGIEVEVDTETGQVRVLRCVQAIDVGKAINPRVCYGQTVGGTVMGLGYALSEEQQIDAEGRIVNPSPRTYRIPLAKDIPAIEAAFIEDSDPYGPCGAKGVGEVVVNCTPPAVINAIAHATGVRLYQLPMTPERVWKAIQASK